MGNTYVVKKIISANNFLVEPDWFWNEQNGNSIIIDGLSKVIENTQQSEKVLNILSGIILEKEVTIQNLSRIISGSLVCDALINGESIADLVKKQL